MAPQRYEPVSNIDQDDEHPTTRADENFHSVPASPPPSFRSRASSLTTSRHLLTSEGHPSTEADRTLADTFNDGSTSDNESYDGGDDRQRLMRGNTVHYADNQTTTVSDGARPVSIQRTVTDFPGVTPVIPGRTRGMPYSTFASSNDGVFANLSAKPERGEKQEEEKPPSYEAAAADATPPYWETTTILAPGLSSPDEVYVDGLPVGSLFSFIWNGMISMSFQIVGFLLTYLLHTTHAAKNGSRAGLGITFIQYGFYMRGSAPAGRVQPSASGEGFAQPSDPNSIDFDPNAVGDSAVAAAAAAMATSNQNAATSGAHSTFSSIANSEWLAYALMIVGWFILIRAVSDFFKARRHEQLVLRSPDRGLNVPVVAEGERAETVV
ncbi:MAG: hypothetical protein Q9219_005976 [cf. Caloplaca sp. 3 TL-2023]